MSRQHKQQHPILSEMLSALNGSQREAYEERAGILEYDAGLERQLAEALALLEMIRLHPLCLSGITVLQIELDGATEWLLTSDVEFARQHLADIFAHEIRVVNLADVLHEQYGGIAILGTVG